MSVPKYEELMLPLLRALADGVEHEAREVRERLAATFRLTQRERTQLIPCGKHAMFDNRVGWAKTYLEKAGLVRTARRGVYNITAIGLRVLADNPRSIDRHYLERFKSFRAFISPDADSALRGVAPARSAMAKAPPDSERAKGQGANRRAFRSRPRGAR